MRFGRASALKDKSFQLLIGEERQETSLLQSYIEGHFVLFY
jgi:hypothetical protein